jgi:hypothetical protein
MLCIVQSNKVRPEQKKLAPFLTFILQKHLFKGEKAFDCSGLVTDPEQ